MNDGLLLMAHMKNFPTIATPGSSLVAFSRMTHSAYHTFMGGNQLRLYFIPDKSIKPPAALTTSSGPPHQLYQNYRTTCHAV
jgi:hypothetical protein